MRCKKCNSKIRKGNKFCRNCGEPVPQRRVWPTVVAVSALSAAAALATIFVLYRTSSPEVLPATPGSETAIADSGSTPSEPADDIERKVEESVNQVYASAGVDVPNSYEFQGEVLEKTPIEESKELLSEAQAKTEMQQRGFEPAGIESNYYSDGTFSTANCMGNESATHPLYTLYHVTDSGELWMICIVNGSVIAMGTSQSEILVEKEYLEVFDGFSNTFIKGIPDASWISMQKVSRIDAAALENMG